MKKHYTLVTIVAVLGLILAACGSSGGDSSNIEAGKALFNQSIIGTNAGCVTCHSLEKGVTIVGPSLAGIATTAATAEAGKSAEEFLKESITDPNAVITEGFSASVMPQNWAQLLTDDQIDQLVDYLMTLK